MWETVMGLEVHAELSTKSKIFCGCTTEFGGKPNSHVCPVCAGMPGVLPKLNRAVVEYAMKAGVALGCTITRDCKFDRKNYFYPDLPKAYQVSQLYAPICTDGKMEIEVNGEKKSIGIREIHMEEDAGKLIHSPNGTTHMDYNRCGVPLIEIVSQPDFRSADEVLAYLEKLRETLLYLGVCDCKMQEGSLRVDVNLSVREYGGDFGTRTEMKNLNSFKAIARAIEYERERQLEIIKKGGEVVQETRRWDDDKGVSLGMRSKENAQDYRYFPEPDLLPLSISEEWLLEIKESIPELAEKKRERYALEYGLSAGEAVILTSHKNISDLFEDVCAKSNEPRESANLIVGDVMRLMNNTATLPENLELDSAKLALLISLVLDKKINRNAYKESVEAVFLHDAEPEEYIRQKGLFMVSDDGATAKIVSEVLAENPGAVEDYRDGKAKAFGFLMGAVMRKLGKGANPETAKKALEEGLTFKK